MVSFIKSNGDTATLRVILGPESKIITSLNGQDSCDLDEFFNTVNTDDAVRHAKLDITYCENESQIMAILAQQKSQQINKKETKKQQSNTSKHTKYENFICPRCGSNEGLMDKDGKTHPCLSCLKIDIGKRIQAEYNSKLEGIMSHIQKN